LLVLGIETSCDETSVAVVEDGRRILSNVVSSQIDIHKRFGGVVPEIASRSHLRVINHILGEALNLAKVTLNDIEAVAVTRGPGLVGSLRVGLCLAKTISYTHTIPLIGVNHLEGHIYASFLEHQDLTPPFLALIVSGGHSELVLVHDHTRLEVIGRTRDDAAGEAFDKVAKLLNLGYPGGPIIDELSKSGDKEAVVFPIAKMKGVRSFDFSFSGLKTAVLNYLKQTQDPICISDLVASFQRAVCSALINKTIEAAQVYKIETIVLGGGVAANSVLREGLKEETRRLEIELYYPSPKLCTDNGAMIAAVGYFRYKSGKRDSLDLDARADLVI